MLYFAIPLKPRCFARDWGCVEALLDRTLRSVLRQTDSRFRVLVAVTDVPDVPLRDPRIELIHVPACGSDPRRGAHDKRARILAMARVVRENGGGMLMPVDADDLVSRRLARFLNRHSEADGFVAPIGLEYDERTGRLRLAPRFSNLCGTSIAVRFQPEELPNGAEGEEKKHVLSVTHNLWVEALRRRGKRLARFPFLPSVYRIYHGENLSLLARGSHGWKRDWLRRVQPGLRPPRWLRVEFGI